MKANEYVKQNGWAMARKAVAECTYGYGIDLDDIKRLVESHELVEKHGGLLNVKNSFQMERDCGGVYMTPFGNKLYQAIADVESCQ